VIAKDKGVILMSSIDLAILGILMEKPRSAYDIQKDVDAHHFSRWTKISAPSIYRKVLQLQEKGYLRSQVQKGGRAADKAVYSVTGAGRAYFSQLMFQCAAQPASFLFDFNVAIANLNKLPQEEALALLDKLRESFAASLEATQGYAEEYAGIPLTGRTIFAQQLALHRALFAWLDGFRHSYEQQTDGSV